MQFRLQTLLMLMVASALLFWLAFAADYWIALPLLVVGAIPQIAGIAVAVATGKPERRAFAVGAASVIWLPIFILVALMLVCPYYLGELLAATWRTAEPGFEWEVFFAEISEPLQPDEEWYEAILRSFLAANFLLTGVAGLIAVLLQRSLAAGQGSRQGAPRRPRLFAMLLVGGYFAVPVATWAAAAYLGDEYGAGCLWGACLLTYPLAIALTCYGRGVWRAVGVALAVATYVTLAGNLLFVFSFPLWIDVLNFDIGPEGNMSVLVLGAFAAKWLVIGMSVCGGLAAWGITAPAAAAVGKEVAGRQAPSQQPGPDATEPATSTV